MTPSALARAIGGTPAMLTRYKQGMIPRLETIDKIAAALGVPRSALLPEDNRTTITSPISTLRENTVDYRAVIASRDKNAWCYDAAERTLAEIQDRLFAMCAADSADYVAQLKAQCITRIEEFTASCRIKP